MRTTDKLSSIIFLTMRKMSSETRHWIHFEVRWWIAWKLCSSRIKSGFKDQLPKLLSSDFRCFRLLNPPERPRWRDVHLSQASYSEFQNAELLANFFFACVPLISVIFVSVLFHLAILYNTPLSVSQWSGHNWHFYPIPCLIPSASKESKGMQACIL